MQSRTQRANQIDQWQVVGGRSVGISSFRPATSYQVGRGAVCTPTCQTGWGAEEKPVESRQERDAGLGEGERNWAEMRYMGEEMLGEDMLDQVCVWMLSHDESLESSHCYPHGLWHQVRAGQKPMLESHVHVSVHESRQAETTAEKPIPTSSLQCCSLKYMYLIEECVCLCTRFT